MSVQSGILRRFNTAGIAEFVRRIETLRAGNTAEIDDAFVTDEKLTEPIVPEVPLERPVHFLSIRLSESLAHLAYQESIICKR